MIPGDNGVDGRSLARNPERNWIVYKPIVGTTMKGDDRMKGIAFFSDRFRSMLGDLSILESV
jgi:hypothetical protein